MAWTPWGAVTETAAEISSTALSLLTLADYVAKQFRDNIPTIQDEVVVEVVGQPGASKRELYYLAMAAANGIVKRRQPLLQLNPFLPPSAASLMIEYDAADHWIRCSLTYRSAAVQGIGTAVPAGIRAAVVDAAETALSALVPGGAFAAFVIGLTIIPNFFNTSAVYRGPQCDVVGEQSNFVSLLPPLPGIPVGVGLGSPNLPWAGRPILTSCPTTVDPRPIPGIAEAPVPSTPLANPGGPIIPSPNPKPVGDNRSRGAVVGPPASPGGTGPDGCCPKTMLLVELVSAALTDPGSDGFETWAPPAVGPGVFAGGPIGG